MQRSRLVLQRPRENRFTMVRQYVGDNWSEEGARERIYVNLISLYCRIVVAKLVANNPRVLLSVWDKTQKPTVNAMMTWVNRKIEQVQLANYLKRVVLDSLFSIGIMKVCLATPEDAALTGWQTKAGQATACRVDLDDFVFDTHARDFTECGFMGHRYRVPLAAIRKSKVFGKAAKGLEASNDRIYNIEGDERINILGQAMYGDTEEYEDFVDLWEVYLPRHGVVLTLRDDDLIGAASESMRDKNFGKALRIQKWIGPNRGPYHLLGLGMVPGNCMPKGPVQDLLDLHLLINNILRKIARRAENSKRNTFVQGSAMTDAERVLTAKDLDIVKIDNPQALQANVETGGVGQDLFQLFIALKEVFSWLSGNLDIMGGLSPQSKTATQDQMLNTNSSATIGDMQKSTIDFTSGVCQALCWYYHHDPHATMKSNFAVDGLPEFSIPRQISPAQRQGILFEDMDIKVSPYSLQFQTPEQLVTDLTGIVQNIITPMMPLLQQQGVNFNVQEFLKKLAHYKDVPDLEDLISFADVSVQQEGDSGGGTPEPGKPAETTRNYVRRSIGNSPHGQDNQIMNALQGAGNMEANGQGK